MKKPTALRFPVMSVRGATRISVALLLAFSAALAVPKTATGALVHVVNAGFEDTALASGGFSGPGAHPGWDGLNSPIVSGVARPPFPGSSPVLLHTIDSTPEGLQFGYSRNGSGLIQVLSATFDPSKSYVLSVQAALSSLSQALEAPKYDMGYRITLGVDGFGTLSTATFNESTGTPRDDTFRLVSTSWNPGDAAPGGAAGAPLFISLITSNLGNTGGASVAAAFDDVKLQATSGVPEPSTGWIWTLACAAFLTATCRRRRRPGVAAAYVQAVNRSV